MLHEAFLKLVLSFPLPPPAPWFRLQWADKVATHRSCQGLRTLSPVGYGRPPYPPPHTHVHTHSHSPLSPVHTRPHTSLLSFCCWIHLPSPLLTSFSCSKPLILPGVFSSFPLTFKALPSHPSSPPACLRGASQLCGTKSSLFPRAGKGLPSQWKAPRHPPGMDLSSSQLIAGAHRAICMVMVTCGFML